MASHNGKVRLLGKAFWIGLVGGFLGFLGGILVLFAGILSESLYSTASQSSTLYEASVAAFVFSIIGVVGGIFENRKFLGASLMLLAAVGILFTASVFGILAFLFFLVGAIVVLAKKAEHEVTVKRPTAPSWESASSIRPAAPSSRQYRYLESVIGPESADASHSYKLCLACGKKLARDAKYCDECGMRAT